VRPESWRPTTDAGLELHVALVEELGADEYVYSNPTDSNVRLTSAHEGGGSLVVRWDPKTAPQAGQTVKVAPIAESVHVFDAATGERI